MMNTWSFWLLSVPGLALMLSTIAGVTRRRAQRRAIEALRMSPLGSLPPGNEPVLAGGTVVSQKTLVDPVNGSAVVAWRLRVTYKETTVRYSGRERETETREVTVVDTHESADFDLQDASGRAHIVNAFGTEQREIRSIYLLNQDAKSLPRSVAARCADKLPKDKAIDVRLQVLRPGEALLLMGAPTQGEMVPSAEGYRVSTTEWTFRDDPDAPLLLCDEGERDLRDALIARVGASVRWRFMAGTLLLLAGIVLPHLPVPRGE